MTLELQPKDTARRLTPSGAFVEAFLNAQMRSHVDSRALAAMLSRGASDTTRPRAVEAMFSLGVRDTFDTDPLAGEIAEAVLVEWGISQRRLGHAHQEGVSLASALRRRASKDKAVVSIRTILSTSGPSRLNAIRRAAASAGSFDYVRLADDLYKLERYADRSVARAWSSDYGNV